MWSDAIVEEIRREREAHAERFGFDAAAICEALRELEAQESGREILLPPKPEEKEHSPAA